VPLLGPALFGPTVGAAPRRMLAWRPLLVLVLVLVLVLGLISYGVYLYHADRRHHASLRRRGRPVGQGR
jgi:peptidoglycan/LPS O-acetylase OafA/YrhL